MAVFVCHCWIRLKPHDFFNRLTRTAATNFLCGAVDASFSIMEARIRASVVFYRATQITVCPGFCESNISPLQALTNSFLSVPRV